MFDLIGSHLLLSFFHMDRNIFSFKTFDNEIIDETGVYRPVGVEYDSLRRQREWEDACKEGACDTDLRSELSASLHSGYLSERFGLLP
jgi:hypothetical protein